MLRNLFRARREALAGLPEGERVYAIGDIHGRADLLDRLLLRVGHDVADRDRGQERATLVFLGDYVDRGDRSREVIDRLLELEGSARYETVFLKGNHEDAMLRFLRAPEGNADWLSYGGLATLMSYGVREVAQAMPPERLRAAAAQLAENLPAAHLRFLDRLRLTWQSGGYFFCHAGVCPDLAQAEQPEDSLLWGDPDFFERAWKEGLRVVYGHHVRAAPEIGPNRIGIDTGAYFTGRLTALRLEGASASILQT